LEKRTDICETLRASETDEEDGVKRTGAFHEGFSLKGGEMRPGTSD
jgi:hypothetical protein